MDIRGQTIIPPSVRAPELQDIRRRQTRNFFPIMLAIIIVVVVVLVLLYAIGTFTKDLGGATSILVGRCFGGQTFLCTSPSLSSAGQISYIFGQTTGTPIYQVELACAAGQLPTQSQLNFTPLANLGYPSASLLSGQQISITNETCTGSNGQPLGATSSGTVFTGTIWILYKQTLQSTAQIEKAATVSVAAS